MPLETYAFSKHCYLKAFANSHQKADNTGAGNTCDTVDDPIGCIFTENLLVEDATAAEIDAAVSGVAVGGGAAAVGGNGTGVADVS